MIGANPDSEAAGRPKGEGETLRGNPFPRAPGGSRVADYTGKISNLLEDLKKVERFAQNNEKQIRIPT